MTTATGDDRRAVARSMRFVRNSTVDMIALVPRTRVRAGLANCAPCRDNIIIIAASRTITDPLSAAPVPTSDFHYGNTLYEVCRSFLGLSTRRSQRAKMFDNSSSYISGTLRYFTDASPETRLSVVFAVLLFGTIALFLRNNALHAMVIGLFRDKLRANDIYRIFRTIVAGSFVIAVVFGFFIFFAPIIATYVMGHSVVEIGKVFSSDDEEEKDPALRELHHGNYPLSRKMYLRNLSLTSDHAKIEEIRGYITATYYGQGLHREGLQFICDSYRSLAKGDYRYLFNIHAHLRQIALKQGAETARAVADDFYQRCRRADFSPIWTGIPLGIMETIHDGGTIFEPATNDEEYSASAFGAQLLSGEDRAYLESLIKNPSWKATPGARDHPMYPFALYVTGHFDEALALFPGHFAQLRELTLFDAAVRKANTSRIRLLEMMIEEFPHGQWRAVALRQLLRAYHTMGKESDAARCLRLIDKDEREYVVDSLIQDDVNGGDELVKLGSFAQAHRHFVDASAVRDHYGLPSKDLRTKIRRTAAASTWQTERAPRAQVSDALRMRDEFGWTYPAARYLEQRIDGMATDPRSHAKALYLIASMDRKMGEYGASNDVLLRFEKTVARSDPLYDDVLTEIGYYYFVLEDRRWRARQYLLRVVHEFPTRNAADDALWWLGRIALREADYPLAARYFSQIIAIRETNFLQRARSGIRAAQAKTDIPLPNAEPDL